MDIYDGIMLSFVIVIIMLVTCLSIQDYQMDDTEKTKYKDNIILNDMCIETYNKSYQELSHEEKEHMIRLYRIQRHEYRR